MQRTDLALAGLWALTSVVALGMWFVGAANTPLVLRETVIYHTEPIGEIRGSQTVGQTFKAPYNGLYRIEISLADYGRRNTGKVIFRLKPARELPIVLVEKTFAAEEIRGDVMYAITFSPVSDSAGRIYYFELESPEAVSGNAITAYIRPHNPYSEGTAFWRGEAQPGDLVFTAHFRPTAWERVLALFTQIADGKPWPWNSPAFYLILGALWIFALFVALRHVALTRFDEGSSPSSWPQDFRGGLRALESVQMAEQRREPAMRRALPASVKPGIFLPAILLLVFIRSLLFSSVIPPWLGPDETGHFEYVALIYMLRRIPAPLPETEIIPELTREINASAERLRYEQFFDLWRTFGIRSLSEQEPPKLVGPREAGYQRPFYYLALAPVYGLVARQEILVRYFSLAATSGLLAAFTVWMAAKTAAALFPHSLFIQTLTPLIIAFWPTQAYLASRINNDNLATATAALAFWIITVTVRQGLSLRTATGLATVAALALLAKGSSVFLVPLLLGAAFLGGLRRWHNAMLVAHHYWLMICLCSATLCVGAILAMVLAWPEAARILRDQASQVLWPGRSREWILSALEVLATTSVFTVERIVVSGAEALRLAALFWYPHGWRVYVPTEWVFKAGPVFAVGLWILGVAAVGWGRALRQIAASSANADTWQIWALGLLALAFPMALAPLLTRMIIDPYQHWWHGRVLMTLLLPVSVWLALGWRCVTPSAHRPIALSVVLIALALADAYNLGYIILPVFYQ
jgi:hypothetical protein